MITFRDALNLLKDNKLNYYNVYNSDIKISSYYTSQYYIKNQNDNIDVSDQELSIVYLDIELYVTKPLEFKFDVASELINAITYYDTKSKTFNCLVYLFGENKKHLFDTDTLISKWKSVLIQEKYIKLDENLTLKWFSSELSMLEYLWDQIKKIDPLILSGFNSDKFDYPYIFKRLIKLYGDESKAKNTVSRFGHVSLTEKETINILDYSILDIRYLYMPRSSTGETGLNYGKKLNSFSLDSVSEHELKLNKLNYKDDNLDLNRFYMSDIENFLLYNIVDVCLCVCLNNKLQHIQLHNVIRRSMKTSFSDSLVGNSALFDNYIFYKLSSSGRYVRHGLSKQNTKQIPADDLKQIYIPVSKKTTICPLDIEDNVYNGIVFKFPGAYVKECFPKLINDGSLIIDLDATALYPSCIEMYNIDFTLFKHFVINPICYNFINILEKSLGKVRRFTDFVYQKLFDIIDEHVDSGDYSNKSETKNATYLILSFLLNKLLDSGLTFSEICRPTTSKASIMLYYYLIPALEIRNNIDASKKEYNTFVYDHVFGCVDKYDYVYIIKDIGSSSGYIEKISANECVDLITSHSSTINGCMFSHETGIFTEFLSSFGKKRSEYKKTRDTFGEKTEQWRYYNNRQNAIKTVMNTCYGVMGLKSFRYSNHWLAGAVTASGRLSIKIAQYVTEEYLSGIE